jgi:intracellular multiplication protein IcmL
MAADKIQTIRLRNDFYRDGFQKALLALGIILTAIILLIATSIYLMMTKPSPIYFRTGEEWRVLPSVPVEEPYLKPSDLVQWVSQALPDSFEYDFIDYMTEIKVHQRYFTTDGWQKFTDILNRYANYNKIMKDKLFVMAFPEGAPFILNQGILAGKYAWWVQMPLNVSYSSLGRAYNEELLFQVLVVRVPTLNNLYGVGIDNIVISTTEKKAGA